MMGAALTGPLNIVILFSYRGVQMCRNKKKLGTFINYQKSNWFTKEGKFRRYHLKGVAGVFLPNLFGLVFLSMSFKYASIGGLN